MKKVLFIVLAVVSVACSKHYEEKIVGTWEWETITCTTTIRFTEEGLYFSSSSGMLCFESWSAGRYEVDGNVLKLNFESYNKNDEKICRSTPEYKIEELDDKDFKFTVIGGTIDKVFHWKKIK